MSSLGERRAARQIEDAIQRDDWEKARHLIRQRLRRKPEDHWLLTRLGLTYYEQKQYKRALHYALKALQIEPYCPLAVWDYAGTLDMLGRKKEALSVYRWLTSWGEERLAYGPCGEVQKKGQAFVPSLGVPVAKAAIWQHIGRDATAGMGFLLEEVDVFDDFFLGLKPKRKGADLDTNPLLLNEIPCAAW